MADNLIEKVEGRTELVKAASIEIGATLGGIVINSVADAAKVADLLSRGGVAVPEHCRNEPGVCFALVLQALEWRFPIMSVVNKSYKPKNGDRIAYEAQLIQAVVEARAPLKKMLRTVLIGTGDAMICRVIGHFIGEDEPHTYESQTLGKLKADIGFNDRGQIKGSPLWITKPEVQIRYSAVRDWARLSCPGVLLGVYAPDEIEGSQPIDVTPKVSDLTQRLKDAKVARVVGRGFDVEHVAREAEAQRGHTIIEGTMEEEDHGKDAERDDAGSSDGGERRESGDGHEHDLHTSGDGSASGSAGGAERPSAAVEETAQPESDFPPDLDKRKGEK